MGAASRPMSGLVSHGCELRPNQSLIQIQLHLRHPRGTFNSDSSALVEIGFRHPMERPL